VADGITLVYAGSQEGATRLRSITEEAGWHLEQSSNWRQALDLAVNLPATVFIYDRDANPREWRDALRRTANMRRGPMFLMISRFADEQMWAELLVGRGYDLLLAPLEAAEVVRTIRSAHAHHVNRGAAKGAVSLRAT